MRGAAVVRPTDATNRRSIILTDRSRSFVESSSSHSVEPHVRRKAGVRLQRPVSSKMKCVCLIVVSCVWRWLCDVFILTSSTTRSERGLCEYASYCIQYGPLSLSFDLFINISVKRKFESDYVKMSRVRTSSVWHYLLEETVVRIESWSLIFLVLLCRFVIDYVCLRKPIWFTWKITSTSHIGSRRWHCRQNNSPSTLGKLSIIMFFQRVNGSLPRQRIEVDNGWRRLRSCWLTAVKSRLRCSFNSNSVVT